MKLVELALKVLKSLWDADTDDLANSGKKTQKGKGRLPGVRRYSSETPILWEGLET